MTGRPVQILIIFITANPKSASAAFKGYSVGAVDDIFKPVSADVLISKVNVFVDLYRRSRALERQTGELRRAHAELDQRVRVRTEELARANQRLKAVIAQRRRAEDERVDNSTGDEEGAQRKRRSRTMKRKCVCLSTSVGFAAHLCGASAAVAQTAPPLGAAQSIAVLGGSTVTHTTLLVGRRDQRLRLRRRARGMSLTAETSRSFFS